MLSFGAQPGPVRRKVRRLRIVPNPTAAAQAAGAAGSAGGSTGGRHRKPDPAEPESPEQEPQHAHEATTDVVPSQRAARLTVPPPPAFPVGAVDPWPTGA